MKYRPSFSHLRKQSKIGYNTMGNVVIEGIHSTVEYHVLKSYIIDSLGPTNYFITHYTKKPKIFSDMSCSFSF